MTVGSVLGAVALLGVGWSPSYPVFFAAWILAGVASAGLFYPPAFAALTGWYGDGRVRALTILTLAAGFASTIFAPLTAALASDLTWRQTYLVLAAVLAVVTLPLHLLALRLPWTAVPPRRPGSPGRDRDILTSRTFVLLTAASTLTAFATYAALVNLVPLLTGRGMAPTAAAWALGLGGAGQVAGRLLYPAMSRRLSPRTRAVVVITAMALSLAVLAVVPGPAVFLVAAAVLAGAGRGLFTLVGATLVSDHWGPERYAAISGVHHAPVHVASALAPWAGAAIAGAAGGYPAMFGLLAAVTAVAAATASAVDRSPLSVLRRRSAELVEER
jgi:predicted MFS family arabinose efflux permease